MRSKADTEFRPLPDCPTELPVFQAALCSYSLALKGMYVILTLGGKPAYIHGEPKP